MGVVKNFNANSLHDEIEPLLMLFQNRYLLAGVKIETHDVRGALAAIQDAWDEIYPEFVLSYSFLEETIEQFYEGEKRMATLLNIFTSIAIVIGCLGLFGLVSYMARTAHQRNLRAQSPGGKLLKHPGPALAGVCRASDNRLRICGAGRLFYYGWLVG